MIDRLRRTQRFDVLLPLIGIDDADRGARANRGIEVDEALDDQLALLVGCCHPALAPEAQIALTLRIVGGLSTAQIAKAFFVSDASMTRRITRAKEKIRLAGIPFEPPTVDTLTERLPSVCGVVHSIFTEGHLNTGTGGLVRGDLCDEAIWLGELLHRLVPDEPEVAGLLALMLLIDARRASRVDDEGLPILLIDQDRGTWDWERIDRGVAVLGQAYAARRAGVFQFHAAIAALHASAPSFEATDWGGIVRIYNSLLRRQPTALLTLNRAIAVAEAASPAEALTALDAIPLADDLDGDLTNYSYFHAARAECLARLDRDDEAVVALDDALRCCSNAAERGLLQRRRDVLAI